MFVFLLLLLMNIIFALPMTKKLSITDVYFEGTTIVPHDMIDNTLILNAKNSSNHLSESVNALQLAIRILFPKNDKNVYYEFDDTLLEQKSTAKDMDHLPIHVEHINVARVENNKDKSINDTAEKIQKLIAIENRLINNETTNREKMNLESIFDFSSSQNLKNQSTPLDVSLNIMNVNRFKNDNHGGMFLWSSKNDTIDKTVDIFSNLETVKQVPQYKSTYSINKPKDTDDQDFKTNENLSRLYNKSTYIHILFE
jgi:hypothetical protein